MRMGFGLIMEASAHYPIQKAMDEAGSPPGRTRLRWRPTS
jgi:hypothetical protein